MKMVLPGESIRSCLSHVTVLLKVRHLLDSPY